MKHRYIDALLSEIQLLESKVANLKENQHVSFSFFKESFKRTQEISRLLHDLEFVQIEDMKEQMERLVQFLSEAKEVKVEPKVEVEPIQPMPVPVVKDDTNSASDTVEIVSPKPETITSETETEEEKFVKEEMHKMEPTVEPKTVLAENKSEDKTVQTTKQDTIHKSPVVKSTHQSTPSPVRSIINQQKETIVENLGVKNKSLNDIQPVNQTIQDAKRSISLNDRFLFQRELFDNNREAMNTMMTNLQPFTSFDAIENYLKENTNWNFKDETVDKFMQMLKDSFR